MKTFDVKVERTMVQTAVLRVQAKDKRTAALHADLNSATWTDVATGDIRVKSVEPGAAEPIAPMAPPPAPAPVANAEPAKGGKKAA